MVAVRRGRTATAAEAPVTKRTSSSPSPIRTLRNKSGAPVILPPTVSTPQPTAQELVPLWARVWLAISITIVLWDAAYVLCRPLSFYPTGSLGWIWIPYEKYAKVDLLYGPAYYAKYLAGQEGWNFTQAVMNLAEVGLALLFFVFYAVGQRSSALLALVSCVMTASKTISYALIDVSENFSHSGHNTPFDFWVVYVLPSSLWVVFPVLVCWVIISRIWSELL